MRSRRGRRDDDGPPPPLEPAKALNYALRALAQKALTERELADRLRRRGASPEVVEGTLARLREYRFVDDADLAERAAQDPTQGPFAIRQRLKGRGINEHTIEDALAGRDPDTDLEGARRLVERHRARWAGERAYSRGYTFLARRGYPSAVIAEALEPLRRDATSEELEVED